MRMSATNSASGSGGRSRVRGTGRWRIADSVGERRRPPLRPRSPSIPQQRDLAQQDFIEWPAPDNLKFFDACFTRRGPMAKNDIAALGIDLGKNS
ncbi:hypothetical protein SPHINGO391_70016 [Sphingomonas aurantiaca]|uniref:Uncharacterized protein n=1 Tax=Sphingomonas aurantiaca TaxID=185949 RepID=A0A5E8ALV7_9SPHN|nr:hypothetical protein SPHINGO391_70016 [Sphingomonas aurantiaca]